MIKLNLNENFICRLWEDKSYYSGLKTISGESVEIIDYGRKNHDSGPDYKDAKVKIDGIIFTGSIEIHQTSKSWHQHHHKGDNKYNDVILHVVFYDEAFGVTHSAIVKKTRNIPTVVLSEFLSKSIHDIWNEIIANPHQSFRLPCYSVNNNVNHSIKTEWLSVLSKQRLILKTARIEERLNQITDNHFKKIYWEQILFEFICEALGYSKNKEQFLKLSRKIDLSGLKDHNLSAISIESMLFGTAGFLTDLRFKDPYIDGLKANWIHIRELFRKEIMDKSEWNFFRLRPANFPTLRIAYASSLLYEILNRNFFRNIIKTFEESCNLFNDLEFLFRNIETAGYWKGHNNFGNESKLNSAVIGSERTKDITVNVLLPLVYLYSVKFENESLQNRVEFFYKKEKQKSGSNDIVRLMEKQLDVRVNTLSDEQGLIQLHNLYCTRDRCNECEIGKLVFVEGGAVHEPLRIILY